LRHLKLLVHSTYYFFLFSALILISGGVIFYYTIRTTIYRQIDNSLITEETIIRDQIEETDSIPDFEASFGHLIEVRLHNSPRKYIQAIKDTDLYDTRSRSFMPFRYLRQTGSTPRNTGYTIKIYHHLDENREIMNRIIMGMLILFFALLMISILVNYLVTRRIWNPFFESVNKAAGFNIVSDDPLKLPETKIEEFRHLNEVFEKMTTKMREDYINLKEYNENSSHEIQTPLAVIRSKLELLMQNRSLNKKSLDLIRSIDEATTKLFKLNQGLLLISKIENLQFPETRELSLKKIIEVCLDNYEEILQLKKISIEKEITVPGMVNMNEVLAEIMISNLLSNAVRYNIDGGYIKCRLDHSGLTITNSGTSLNIDPMKLFSRFRKGSQNQQSVGLGLSIVKKIVDNYGMQISYTVDNNIHKIELKFQDEQIS
jgi:signal transduction histidine kinase